MSDDIFIVFIFINSHQVRWHITHELCTIKDVFDDLAEHFGIKKCMIEVETLMFIHPTSLLLSLCMRDERGGDVYVITNDKLLDSPFPGISS